MDTCGQEKYRALTKSYLKNTQVVLFVFSMEDKDTFDGINEWIKIFKENHCKEEKVPKYLVGNKNDLENKIDQSLIDKFAEENKIPFISTSAKNNNNIDKLFEEVGKKLYIDYFKNGDKGQTNIKIDFTKKKEKHKCCFSKSDL